MNGLFNKIAMASLLVTGLAVSSLALAEGSFDGHNVNVKFEIWKADLFKDDDGNVVGFNITETLAVRDEANIVASDDSSPDLIGVHTQVENHLWDIDFNNRVIKLVFTSITDPNYDNHGMWMSPVGFHLEDVDGTLPEIVGVKVNDQYAPSFFNKALVNFDANNIYVSLQGSMCHIDGMGSMPECDNVESPTKYNNIIEVEVEFAGNIVGNDKIDQLLTWAEGKYPELFHNHMESMDMFGYRARFYPETNVYTGVKDQRLYYYDANTSELLDLGPVAPWLITAGIECPEGQHSMGDGMCMDNMMMGM